MKKIFVLIIAMGIMLTGCADDAEQSTLAETTTQISQAVQATQAENTITSAVTTAVETTITIESPTYLPTDVIEQVEFENVNLLQFEFKTDCFVDDETYFDTALIEKAKKTFINSRYYTKILENREKKLSDDNIDFGPMFSDYYDCDTLVPLFENGITDDFDSNGENESFIVLSIPDYSWFPYADSAIIFIGSDGTAKVISFGYYLNNIGLIDYGSFKHIDVKYGMNNATTKYEIISVNKNSAKLEMRNCYRGTPFLGNRLMRFRGIQQTCDMAAFWDNNDKCYKQLGGAEYDLDTFKKYYNNTEYEPCAITVFGNRYFVMDIQGEYDVYPKDFTYENGNLIWDESSCGLSTTDNQYTSYRLDFYIDDGTEIAPIPPVAYLDLNNIAYNPQALDYIDKLKANKQFITCASNGFSAQIADLNNDCCPEIIFENNPYGGLYESHYSMVFSMKDNEVFYVCEDDSSFSYYGSGVTAYTDKSGDNVFLADVSYGGAGTGEFGTIRIDFDGEKITSHNVYRYNWQGENNTLQYQYFDKEFTAEENRDKYDEYMNSLTLDENFYSDYVLLHTFDDFMPIGYDEACIRITEALDEFYAAQ